MKGLIRYFFIFSVKMEPMTVTGVDFFCQENAKGHHTDEYDLTKGETPTPILRRGEIFKLGINLNRAYDTEKDVIRVSFGFGKITFSIPVL